MTDDAFLGNVIGAGLTLMIADKVLNPRRTRTRYRTVYRRRKDVRKKRK